MNHIDKTLFFFCRAYHAKAIQLSWFIDLSLVFNVFHTFSPVCPPRTGEECSRWVGENILEQ